MRGTTTREAGLERPRRGWRTGPGIGAGAAALLLLAAGAPGLGAQAWDFEWSERVSAGQTLEIKGVNGWIEARAADGDGARVRAEKQARRSDPSEVRIEVVEHDDGVTICAVYPHPRRENRCEPGSRGGSSVEDNDVRVNFTVRVPAGVRFLGKTVNGDVEVRDLEGDVEARTVNGDVEISTTGVARASTVNGSIRAAMGAAPREPIEFNTVNGGITLDVPSEIDADVDARWVNGGLETDMPLTVVGRLSRQRARGRLGAGGPLMELTTVNGSIRIR